MVTKCMNCDKTEPKFHCGGCKKASYCSQVCQKTHWSTHKLACSHSTRLIETVVVDGTKIESRMIPANELDSSWEKCLLTSMFGVPLMSRQIGVQTKKPEQEFAIFLLIDPVSGLAANKYQTGCGIIQFARSDRANFTVDSFWEVYSYCFDLIDYYSEDNFNYEIYKAKMLNEDAFKRSLNTINMQKFKQLNQPKKKIQYFSYKNFHAHVQNDITMEHMLALGPGITFNNEAYQAYERGNYYESLEKYKKAIEIKLKAYGENSIHICISLSGLADCYLKLGDLENATKEAQRMLRISECIKRPDQIKIANEILIDIKKATKSKFKSRK